MSDRKPTPRRKPTKYGVYPMSEGELLVRGTTDPYEALRFLVDTAGDEHFKMEYLPEIGPDEIEGWDGDPIDVQIVADWLHRTAADAEVGYFRMCVCSPDHPEGWSWQLGRAKAPGHGIFQGVYFD